MINNIKNYIFDLDHTLYDSKSNFFENHLKSMALFISENLNVSFDEAIILRDKYHNKYGLTVEGLIVNHNVNRMSFINYLDKVSTENLKKNEELNSVLKKLKFNKYIFTNASNNHTTRVMKDLGLDEILFDGIATAENINWLNKPNIDSFHAVFKKFNIKPEESIFFEDSSSNLITAKKIKMKTVLIEVDEQSYQNFLNIKEIDYYAISVLDFFENNYKTRDDIYN